MAFTEIAWGRSENGEYKHYVRDRLRALEALGKAESMFSHRVVSVPEIPKLNPAEVKVLREQASLLDLLDREETG